MPSTAIGKIGYDDATRQLRVSFLTSGRTYVYFDVPRAAYDAFRRAFSKGAWFNTHIRDTYRHEAAAPSAGPIHPQGKAPRPR